MYRKTLFIGLRVKFIYSNFFHIIHGVSLLLHSLSDAVGYLHFTPHSLYDRVFTPHTHTLSLMQWNFHIVTKNNIYIDNKFYLGPLRFLLGFDELLHMLVFIPSMIIIWLSSPRTLLCWLSHLDLFSIIWFHNLYVTLVIKYCCCIVGSLKFT